MKKSNVFRACAAALALAGGAVQATTVDYFTWNYYDDDRHWQNSPSHWGNEGRTNNSKVWIENATAWANTGGTKNHAWGSKGGTFQKQLLQDDGDYNLRVRTDYAKYGHTASDYSYPNHAMDNYHAEEFILFEFNRPVALSHLRIGWPEGCNCSGYDTDMTILAYKGHGPAVVDGHTSSYDLDDDSNYWLNHVANVDKGPSGSKYGHWTSVGNHDKVESKSWLVGAYNWHLGGHLSANNDFMKLASLKGHFSDHPPGVPEPATASLLMLGGIAGVARARRRRS